MVLLQGTAGGSRHCFNRVALCKPIQLSRHRRPARDMERDQALSAVASGFADSFEKEEQNGSKEDPDAGWGLR